MVERTRKQKPELKMTPEEEIEFLRGELNAVKAQYEERVDMVDVLKKNLDDVRAVNAEQKTRITALTDELKTFANRVANAESDKRQIENAMSRLQGYVMSMLDASGKELPPIIRHLLPEYMTADAGFSSDMYRNFGRNR